MRQQSDWEHDDVAASDLRGLFAPPSHLLFVQDRTLLVRPFDLTTLRATGDPASVAGSVGYVWQGIDAAFSASSTGVLAYESAHYPVTELVWLDRSGRRLGRIGDPGHYLNIRLSADERLLVTERIDPNTGLHHIWKPDLARNGNASRLTLGAMSRHMPILNNDDGREIFYLAADRSVMAVALRNGPTLDPETPQALFRIRALPSGVPTGINDRIRFCVAHDGQRFLVNSPIDGAGPQAITVAIKWPSLLDGH